MNDFKSVKSWLFKKVNCVHVGLAVVVGVCVVVGRSVVVVSGCRVVLTAKSVNRCYQRIQK